MAKNFFYMFYTTMIRLRIDRATTFLPLSLAKGTLQQRLQRAKVLNLKFYDDLQDEFVKREVKPSAFRRVLKETADNKISVNVFDMNTVKLPKVAMALNIRANQKVKGFSFYLPFSFVNGKIPKKAQFSFLPETQKFFNSILNPKFLTRKLAVVNHNPEQMQEVLEFYTKNIEGSGVLKKEALHKFLKDKKNDEKINLLQLLRYTLIDEKAVQQAAYSMDRHIEKAENLKFANKSYDLTPYQYDEKLALLYETLAKTIKDARAK